MSAQTRISSRLESPAILGLLESLAFFGQLVLSPGLQLAAPCTDAPSSCSKIKLMWPYPNAPMPVFNLGGGGSAPPPHPTLAVQPWPTWPITSPSKFKKRVISADCFWGDIISKERKKESNRKTSEWNNKGLLEAASATVLPGEEGENGSPTCRAAVGTKLEIDSGCLLFIVLILLLCFCLHSNCLEHSNKSKQKQLKNRQEHFYIRLISTLMQEIK